MNFKEAQEQYWNYYISLEEQFIETRRYVEFDFINNAKAYSIEYLKLFQAACSEIDVVGKQLASLLNSSFKVKKHTGINEWWYHLTEMDATIVNRRCSLFGKYDLQPWKDYIVVKNPNKGAKKYILDVHSYSYSKTPLWWKDYNTVKHNRTGKFEAHSTNYARANLNNMFLSFAALYSLEVKLMETVRGKSAECVPTDMESKLFNEDLSFYTHILSAVI